MLKSVADSIMEIECNECMNMYTQDLTGYVSKYLEEHAQYENLMCECPECYLIEGFNLNIPIDDTDEPFATGELPLNEEVQRYYIRIIIRLIREDFTNGS